MPASSRSLTYRETGVDIAAKEEILAGVRARIRATHREGTLGTGGEFGGCALTQHQHIQLIAAPLEGLIETSE